MNAFFFAAVVIFSPHRIPSDEVPNPAIIKQLEFIFNDKALERLAAEGTKHLDTYNFVLSSGKYSSNEIWKVLLILREMKGDRSSSVIPTIRCITHEQISVRQASLRLLECIAEPKHSGAIAQALCDERIAVVYTCAETLAATGDENTLLIFDVWVTSHHHPKNGDLRIHIVKCQRDLKARLEKESAEKKKAEPPKK